MNFIRSGSLAAAFAAFGAAGHAESQLATGNPALDMGAVFAGATLCEYQLDEDLVRAFMQRGNDSDDSFVDLVTLASQEAIKMLVSVSPAEKELFCVELQLLAQDLGLEDH